MSVTTYVSAMKKLTRSDLNLITVINRCSEEGLALPEDVLEKLRASVGTAFLDGALEDGEGEYINIDASGIVDTSMIEFSLHVHPAKEGRAEEGGIIINLAKLPEGTVALRVYMSD